MRVTSFSLMLLSFGLSFPEATLAQTGVTLVVKSDTNCEWKLDGQLMGPLKPDVPELVLVSRGEHLIEASAPTGRVETRSRIEFEVEDVEKTVAILLKDGHAQSIKLQHPERPTTPADADAETKETWTDSATGLMWTRNDNGSDVDWTQAAAYCSKLQLAGLTHWRLPTNEELLSIYDLSVAARKTFGDGATRDVHVKGNLNLTGAVWSGSPRENLGKPFEGSWFFTFAWARSPSDSITYPATNFTHYSHDMRALCVRQPEVNAAPK